MGEVGTTMIKKNVKGIGVTKNTMVNRRRNRNLILKGKGGILRVRRPKGIRNQTKTVEHTKEKLNEVTDEHGSQLLEIKARLSEIDEINTALCHLMQK